MGEKNDGDRREQQKLARVLAGIEKTAREASLTGQLSGGQGVAIRQYNAILERLEGADAVPEGIFAPLPEGAEFDEVGVAASSLAQYLGSGEDDEEGRRRGRTGGGVFEAGPGHVKIVGFPGDISDLGVMLREYLPDFLRQRVGEAMAGVHHPPEPPEPPTPPTPPIPPAPPGAGFWGGSGGAWHWSSGSGAPTAPQAHGPHAHGFHFQGTHQESAPAPPGAGNPSGVETGLYTETEFRTDTETRTDTQFTMESTGNLAAEIAAVDRRIAELTARLGAPGADPGVIAAAARELAEVAQRRAVLEQRRGEDSALEV